MTANRVAPLIMVVYWPGFLHFDESGIFCPDHFDFKGFARARAGIRESYGSSLLYGNLNYKQLSIILIEGKSFIIRKSTGKTALWQP